MGQFLSNSITKHNSFLRTSHDVRITVKPLITGHLRNAATSLNKTPLLVSCEIPHVDMCTLDSSEIRTPPYTYRVAFYGPNVSLLQRFHCTGLFTVVPRCPYYRGSTVQDCLLWSQWCPYYGGSTAQDCLLWSQWCPYYGGFTAQDCLLWSQWCSYYSSCTVLRSCLVVLLQKYVRCSLDKAKAIISTVLFCCSTPRQENTPRNRCMHVYVYAPSHPRSKCSLHIVNEALPAVQTGHQSFRPIMIVMMSQTC